MIVALGCLAAVVAAIIQRVTGLAFVLVLIGPVVLIHGPVEGVTLVVLLAVVASVFAVPTAWREVDWPRTLWLLGAGLAAAPFGVLLTRTLPDAALLLLIGGMAVLALLASRIGGVVSATLRGRQGAILAGAAAGFMHASSGLSGPALAAFAVGDRWEQRRFAASAQVVFLGYGVVSVALRACPRPLRPKCSCSPRRPPPASSSAPSSLAGSARRRRGSRCSGAHGRERSSS